MYPHWSAHHETKQAHHVLDEKLYGYRGKKEAVQMICAEQRRFSQYVFGWDNPDFERENAHGCVRYTGKDALQEWFPESKLSLRDEHVDVKSAVIAWVNTYLEQHDYVDVDLDKDERAGVLYGINAIVRPYLKEFGRRTEYTALQSALKKCSDYQTKRVGEAKKDIYHITHR